MNGSALFVAAVQSTVLLSAALLIAYFLHESPAARQVICRATVIAVAVILVCFPWLPSRPNPLVPVSMPSWRARPFQGPMWTFGEGTPQSASAPNVRLPAGPSKKVAPQTAGVDVLQLLIGLWVAGAGCLAATLGLGYWRLNALRRSCQPPLEGEVYDAVARACAVFHVAMPRILSGAGVATPFVTGIRQPTLYVPSSWTGNLDRDALDGVCRHEIAHLDGRDLHWQLAYRVCTVLFWPQPLFWVLTRYATASSEEICDEKVLASGCSPQAYATTLLDLKDVVRRSRNPVPFGIGAVTIRSAFGRRIFAIMNSTTIHRKELTRSSRFSLALGIGLMTALTTVVIAAPVESSAFKTSRAGLSGGLTAGEPHYTRPAGWLGYSGEEDQNLTTKGVSPLSVKGFEIRTDSSVTHGGKASCYIHVKPNAETYYRGLFQSIRADDYRGKRVRLEAHLKTSGVPEGASIFLDEISKEGYTLFVSKDPLHSAGAVDWQPYSLVIDVPANARALTLGVMVKNAGDLWLSDLSLTIADPAKFKPSGRALTANGDAIQRANIDNLPLAPVDLDFNSGFKDGSAGR